MNSGGRWWGRSKLPPMLWRMETAYSGLSPLLREVRLSIVMAGEPNLDAYEVANVQVALKLAKWDRTVALSVGDIPHGPDALGDTVFDMTSVRRRGKKPRQRKRRYRPVVDRGCSKKKAHKTQAEAQVVVDQIKARRVFILGLGAPSTYRCGRCGYWHHGSAALELPAISMKKQCATCGQPIEAFAREVLGTLVKCPGPHGGPATSRSIL